LVPELDGVAARDRVGRLMRRAVDIDVLACARCGGRLPLIATTWTPESAVSP
jgi:hypothetical protein